MFIVHKDVSEISENSSWNDPVLNYYHFVYIVVKVIDLYVLHRATTRLHIYCHVVYFVEGTIVQPSVYFMMWVVSKGLG